MNKYTIYFLVSVFLLYPAFLLSNEEVLAASSVDAYSQDQEHASDIKDDISKIQKKLDQAQQKKQSLEKNLNQISSSLNSTLSSISKTQAALREATDTIKRKELEIQLLEEKATLKKDLIKNLLQELYVASDKPLASVILGEDDFSSAMDEADNIGELNKKVKGLLDDLKGLKGQTEEEKGNLEELKKTHEGVLVQKSQEKNELVADKVETQGDIADQEKVISRLKKELSELQGDLSKILGKSYNAKDIQEAVEFASKATGVPKGFLFGMLKMETNLGANVGGCTYAQVEDGALANYKSGKLSKTSWNTFQTRREVFKGITKELGLDYRKQKVSCNPSGYRGTGGAMGVAQFMPDTWNGYKAQVSSITGHHPPSPWNLTDGVTAMASKLKRTPGVTSGSTSAMKSAACSYLGTCYAPYVNGILYWADHYKDLFK